MVDTVDNNGPPPPELVLFLEVKRYNTLPEGGGLFDQDYKLLTTMTVLGNVFEVLSKFRNAVGAQIHQLTDGDRKIIAALRDEGYI